MIEPTVGNNGNSNFDDQIADTNETENLNLIPETISPEVLEKYVTRNEDTECLVDDTVLMSNSQNNNTNENDFFLPTDYMSTTNTGEIPTEVEEKV